MLTAHHVLIEGEWALPESLIVNGQPTRFTLEASAGYDNALAFDPSREAEYVQNRARDWAIVRVDALSDPNAVLPRQGDGTVKPGETLYMVGVELKEGHRTIEAIPLRIPRRKVDSTQQLPRLTYARLPRNADWSGWSGSFIGRYHKNHDQWKLVGIATTVVMEAERAENQLMIIVRPPDNAIRRLFQPPATAPKDAPFSGS